MDDGWWTEYGAEARKEFHGERITTNSISARRWGIGYVKPDATDVISRDTRAIATGSNGTDAGQNSGYCAIQLAIRNGARKIVLLGFDCQRTRGESHCHGDHPGKLGNGIERLPDGTVVEKYPVWRKRLEQLAPLAAARGIEIVNASRETAVTCFPRMDLQDALDRLHGGAREDRPAA